MNRHTASRTSCKGPGFAMVGFMFNIFWFSVVSGGAYPHVFGSHTIALVL
jgi:hypothetical protein